MDVIDSLNKVTLEEKYYIFQMEAWKKEMDALEKQIRNTIENNLEIIKQNEIQLCWHIKRIQRGIDEHNDWIAKHDITEDEYKAMLK
jgi:hypothetical protein